MAAWGINIFYELPPPLTKDRQTLTTMHLRCYSCGEQIMFLDIFSAFHCIFCLMLLVVFIKLHKFARYSSCSIVKS